MEELEAKETFILGHTILNLISIDRPGYTSSRSGNLGFSPQNFLRKCGICDTYDHQI